MGKKSKNNPNGANQFVADPRQALFLSYYLDPKSKTFSNALQSALKAGFSEEYASVLTSQMPDWLSDKLSKLNMLTKAERNLDEIMDLPNMVQAMGAFGPIFEGKGEHKKPVMTYATGLLKVKADVSKFVAERVGKDKYGDNPADDIPHQTIIIINTPNGNTAVGIQSLTKAI